MNSKLNEKKIELKKLFTIDSILCVNQKEIELNDNYKDYDVVKLLTIDRNKKYQQNESLEKTTNEEIREEPIKSSIESNKSKKNGDFNNDSFSKDDFASKYYSNNSDFNRMRRYSDDNPRSNSTYKIENKNHASFSNFSNNTNSIYLNKKPTDDSNIDSSKKNMIYPAVYAEDLTTKAQTLKHFICSTIKNPKLIKDNPFEVTNEAMQCFIQSNQQEFQQNNFSNNFQYCFPRIIASSGGPNYNGFQGNSFINYNQLLSINSGKKFRIKL